MADDKKTAVELPQNPDLKKLIEEKKNLLEALKEHVSKQKP